MEEFAMHSVAFFCCKKMSFSEVLINTSKILSNFIKQKYR